jgi:hypothetical protein
MRANRALLIVAATVSIVVVGAACGFCQVSPIEVIETDKGETFMRHHYVVNAPLARVWHAFTTEEGLKAWVAPIVSADFRVGGHIQYSWHSPDESSDALITLNVWIVNYLPERLITTRSEVLGTFESPPGSTFRITEFEAVGEEATRVTDWGFIDEKLSESNILEQALATRARLAADSYDALCRSLAGNPVEWEGMLERRSN